MPDGAVRMGGARKLPRGIFSLNYMPTSPSRARSVAVRSDVKPLRRLLAAACGWLRLRMVAAALVIHAGGLGTAKGIDFEMSVSFEDAGTLETVTRTVDGLPITFPVDEADVV